MTQRGRWHFLRIFPIEASVEQDYTYAYGSGNQNSGVATSYAWRCYMR